MQDTSSRLMLLGLAAIVVAVVLGLYTLIEGGKWDERKSIRELQAVNLRMAGKPDPELLLTSAEKFKTERIISLVGLGIGFVFAGVGWSLSGRREPPPKL